VFTCVNVLLRCVVRCLCTQDFREIFETKQKMA